MKKKLSLFIFFLIILAVGISFLIKKSVGDIRPALLPATPFFSEKPSTVVNAGAPTELEVAAGLKATFFSNQTPGARDLEFSPGGTLIVSSLTQGKVFALPDKNKDGAVDETRTLLSGLTHPHGVAFHDGKLFVAEETQLVRYSWDENALKATFEKKLLDLPKGPSLHKSRSIVFDKEGKLYISLGSPCNICEPGDERFASVMVTDAEGNTPHIFARGLRNAVFLTMNPDTGKIWVTDMGRDLLGDDTPPEEINILQENGNYGWPYCFGNKVFDGNFGKKTAAFCQNTVTPIFEMQAHSAPLGLTFINSPQLPADWQGDLLVAFHGSWNRSIPTGYKVVRLNVEGEKITGQEDFLTGFLSGSSAKGRPVDVIFDSEGSLFVSDDKAGAVYKITRVK